MPVVRIIGPLPREQQIPVAIVHRQPSITTGQRGKAQEPVIQGTKIQGAIVPLPGVEIHKDHQEVVLHRDHHILQAVVVVVLPVAGLHQYAHLVDLPDRGANHTSYLWLCQLLVVYENQNYHEFSQNAYT